MNTDLILPLAVGVLVGASSAYLGSFMVLRRMSLVGDALSHVALPGIALALVAGLNPMLGALATLALATLGIWYLEEHTEIYPEALVGVFFTVSLALGLLLTPEPELLEALFGDIDKITWLDGLLVTAGAVLIFLVTRFISRKLLLATVSADLARAQKINTARINLVYLLLVSLVVTLGVKFLGTLLTGAMVIIPAVTAKNMADSIKEFHWYAAILGAVSAILGILIARGLGVASGPAVVVVSAGLFVISYIFKKK